MNKLVIVSACILGLVGCQEKQTQVRNDKEFSNELSAKIGNIHAEPKGKLPEGANIYEELVHVMGTAESAKAGIIIGFDANKRAAILANPKLSEKAFDDVEERMNEILDEELAIFIKDVSVIYSDFYTEEEAKELIDFYNSPIGQKTRETEGSIMQEALPYSLALGNRLEARLKE